MSVRVTFDLALDDPRTPDTGDVLTTARKVYRITEARPVDSPVWDNRWRLTLTEIGTIVELRDTTIAVPDGGNTWHSTRYAKGETPAEFFARRGAA